jgi:hypothetical protein
MKRTISTSLIALLPLSFAACGGGGGGGNEDCTPTSGSNTAKYVTNSVSVPQQRTDFSIDLNGDGRQDNQLGNIIGALMGQNLNVQDGVTQAVNNGQLIILAAETSSDATFSADMCASTELQLGSITGTTPDYSGNGTFMGKGSAGGTFHGPITAGKFNSSSPVTTKQPVSVTIALPLIAGATPVSLHVIGAHIQYTRGADGKISGGQLHGAIKNTDVQSTIIPNVAMLLTMKVNDGSAAGMQIENIFDNGGKADPACGTTCKNPDGTCAVAKDKKIDPCEVATSGLIQNVLSPDVQMFDSAGNYAPNAANTTKDSLSLGIAFTMVGAKF